MLRHTLATLAYRLQQALLDSPDGFAEYRASESLRTPVEILAHMGDLMDWALTLTEGEHVWREAAPLPWTEEIARFFTGLAALDRRISAGPLKCEDNRLFQGPIADALTHTGQIALLRRIYGMPVKPRNYFRAEIVVLNA